MRLTVCSNGSDFQGWEVDFQLTGCLPRPCNRNAIKHPKILVTYTLYFFFSSLTALQGCQCHRFPWELNRLACFPRENCMEPINTQQTSKLFYDYQLRKCLRNPVQYMAYSLTRGALARLVGSWPLIWLRVRSLFNQRNFA